jgi:hypothetical protein
VLGLATLLPLFLHLYPSHFPFEIFLIWNLNSAPADLNKELQIKDGREITALLKVKNALHFITKEQGLSIKWGGEGISFGETELGRGVTKG